MIRSKKPKSQKAVAHAARALQLFGFFVENQLIFKNYVN